MEGPGEAYGWAVQVIWRLGYRGAQLVAVLLIVATLLFILVRLSASPATVLAGAQASQAQVRTASLVYGLDRPIWNQYLTFVGRALRLDFGDSPAHRTAALEVVRVRLPATLVLAAAALAVTSLLAVSLGVWLGLRARQPEHGWAFRLLLTGQSLPALVVGLVLAYAFGLTSAGGGSSPLTLTLSVATLTWWLVPRFARLTAGSVAGAARQSWVLTARAMGATSRELLWNHVLPNALLAATALVGVQVAFLLSGAVIVEWLFGWPGIGDLMVVSIRAGDFPVVEAAIFMIAALVYATYALVDLIITTVDPRLRRPGASM
jgi:peptide/nickel transport system permease protein